jgi:ketosteroid isomerase-like protein
MSQAEEPTQSQGAQVRALVNRQVQAWEKRDFAIAADDWLPNGESFSPRGHVAKKDMQSAILDYFKKFTDLKVTVNEMFLSEDGTRLAIQWDWTVTRKRDRKRATTHDAILVHLVGGKIAAWNEYFDFGNSLDAKP